MLKLGLVGLPNVGKSTVFNALCHGGARVSNFPFCTVEPNLGVVPVPDSRLEALARLSRQSKITPASIEFVDIAGLVRGASKGEGLGNQFLSHIRGVDGLLEVVRCFPASEIGHVEATLDPARDVEIVGLELILADLALVLRRLGEAEAKAKSGAAEHLAEAGFLERVRDHLDRGEPARTLALSSEEKERLEGLSLLSGKPLLYVANTGEQGDSEAEQALARLRAHLADRRAPLLALNAKLEADLGELGEEERAEFVRELGVDATALERVIQASYGLLGLVTFFTIVGRELRAWPVPTGSSARKAAGRVHSDMEAGFIKAEVIGFPALLEAGSWEEAQQRGLVRVEGKDYRVSEGDVIHFRFHR